MVYTLGTHRHWMVRRVTPWRFRSMPEALFWHCLITITSHQQLRTPLIRRQVLQYTLRRIREKLSILRIHILRHPRQQAETMKTNTRKRRVTTEMNYYRGIRVLNLRARIVEQTKALLIQVVNTVLSDHRCTLSRTRPKRPSSHRFLPEAGNSTHQWG